MFNLIIYVIGRTSLERTSEKSTTMHSGSNVTASRNDYRECAGVGWSAVRKSCCYAKTYVCMGADGVALLERTTAKRGGTTRSERKRPRSATYRCCSNEPAVTG
ncbi:hypothetical protein Q1695_009133 [Nippostrongylus brasiliensis]|nr:hypothetical protein Q1695_009133 [Nippostrongylus brasiliensis]